MRAQLASKGWQQGPQRLAYPAAAWVLSAVERTREKGRTWGWILGYKTSKVRRGLELSQGPQSMAKAVLILSRAG